MPVNASSDSIERRVRILALPEEIFPYLVVPERIRAWMGVQLEVDPRPGGIYHVAVTHKNVVRGEFVIVDPPKRLVFTWGWEEGGSSPPPGASTVEIALEPDGDGTIVNLRHSGLSETERTGHGVGWDHYLDRLVVAGAGDDPGTDPWVEE